MNWKSFLAMLMVLGIVSTGHAATILETTDSLELTTSSTAQIDYTASWADHTSTTFTPGKSAGAITTATTTTIVGAPAASTQRQLKQLTLRNTSTTTANTLVLQRDVSATNRTMSGFSLGPGDWMDMDSNGILSFYTQAGVRKESVLSAGDDGYTRVYHKSTTAKDAAGYWYGMMKDVGIPGAYVLQSPGLNGFTTDCSIASQTTDPNGAAQIGSNVLNDPSTGSLYLKNLSVTASAQDLYYLIDILWYNTGLVVTTTTAQTITPPTLPARDLNGTNNGAGVQAAIYAVAALGNAAVVSNSTISYTDQDGNAGAVGTFQANIGFQAPATPVIGTWMPFSLAAGDSGIRNLASITLGTTYTSGTMSLFLYRVLASISPTVVNVGFTQDFGNPGIKIWPNSCLAVIAAGSASSPIPSLSYTIVER